MADAVEEVVAVDSGALRVRELPPHDLALGQRQVLRVGGDRVVLERAGLQLVLGSEERALDLLTLFIVVLEELLAIILIFVLTEGAPVRLQSLLQVSKLLLDGWVSLRMHLLLSDPACLHLVDLALDAFDL